MKEILSKTQKQKELLLIAISIGILLLVLIVIFLFAQSAVNAQQPAETPINEQTYTVEPYRPFEHVSISAKAAIVKHAHTGVVLYEKNADEALPLASLTKVITALTAHEILDEYQKDVVQIDWDDLQQQGDDSLIVGEHFTMQDLLDFVLISSSNDGARALASASGALLVSDSATQSETDAFIARMNTVAQKIGMQNTIFLNESGLDKDEANRIAGATGSARDVVVLFEYVLEEIPSLLEATRESSVIIQSKEGYAHDVKNTNEIVGSLPNIIGSKTGFTNTAGGNLAVVIDPSLNDPIVIVVLGSSREGRFKDVERLTLATLEQLALTQ